MLERDPELLALRTSQGEYGEKPPASYHIYFWSIGPDLSPLAVARQFEQAEAVALLRSFATPTDLFLEACRGGDETAARRLVGQHPSLVDELTADDHRALPDAAWSANARAVALMLELGFDAAANAHGNGGTVLHCAAWQGRVECVDEALRHEDARALIGVRDANWNATPLGWCVHGAEHCGRPGADHAGVARLLIEAGARPDGEMTDLPEGLRGVFRGFGLG
jgi:hypothetical protein